MRRFVRTILCLIWVTLIAAPTQASDYVAMTSPLPPYTINKGLHVKGIAVDTLAIIMTLSGSPMTTDDVKLMLWSHAFKQTTKGPHRIMLNVPKTSQLSPLFKWVGPLHVTKYVIIGRKDGKQITSTADLSGYKVGTIRNSLPEKALIASGVQKKDIASSVTHVIPLKKLDNKMVDYFVHTDTSATYLMKKMGMKMNKYAVLHTYLEVPLYYAFSKDTKDTFINLLNENLVKMKKPGTDGKSRFDKIVSKYLPNGVMN